MFTALKFSKTLSVASRAKTARLILLLSSSLISLSCREGNDNLENGDLGIVASYEGGSNQVAGRRRIYPVPLMVKVVEPDTGITVPDMEIQYYQTTSTDAVIPEYIRASSD